MSAFEAAGVRLYALSYDEPEALRDFQHAHGITFQMLSDPESAVIRQLGILNTLIAEDDHPWFGIPFPGTYVIDAGGLITHKFFESNLALRVGPEPLLLAVKGESQDVFVDPAVGAGIVNETLAPEIFLDGDRLAVGVLRHLVARFDVPEGRHLYAAPAPSGMVAVDLELDPHPRLVSKPLERPACERHTVAITGESFSVHHGRVEMRMPIAVNGSLLSEDNENEVTLSGTLRWQACDDEVCDVPQSQRFELTLSVVNPLISEFMGKAGSGRVREMNTKSHFERMKSRRETGT